MTMIPTEGRLAGPREPTDYEKRIYGEGVQLHEITALPLEVGHGALPPALQAVGHLTMRHWASKQAMLIADFDTAIIEAADEMKADLQKRRVAAAADLTSLNKRIAAVAAALGVSHS